MKPKTYNASHEKLKAEKLEQKQKAHETLQLAKSQNRPVKFLKQGQTGLKTIKNKQK